MHSQRERDTSAVKWIKTRIRSTMKINLLNSLLMIPINDSSLKNKVQVIKIVIQAVKKYDCINHYKQNTNQ